MKKLLIFIIFLFIGIVLGNSYYVWESNQTNSNMAGVKKEPRFSIEKGPKNSEVGTMQSMSGTIKWESRIATEASQIIKPVPIRQGEELISGEDGSATIHYQRGLTISLSPNSHISFVQMLPTNFVLNQLKGTIEYQINKSTPLAIRALHLLTQMNDGDVSMGVDLEKESIRITVKRGSVTIAFNDLQNVSNVINLKEGDKYLFDDENRQGNVTTDH